MSKIEEVKKARLAAIKADLAKYGIDGTTEVVYRSEERRVGKEC